MGALVIIIIIIGRFGIANKLSVEFVKCNIICTS